MRKDRALWLRAAIGLVVLSAMAFAAFTYHSGFRWTQGVVSVPEQSPGAAAFTHTFVINTSPGGPTTPPPGGGFGDVIYAIEEGRDDRGPFCSIVWIPGSSSPHRGMLPNHPCYPFEFGTLNGLIPGIPPVTPDGSGRSTGFDCAIAPFVSPSGTGNIYRMLYRPTNDPVNPGWNSTPGAAGQIEDGIAAVHAVAQMFRQYIADQRAGTFVGSGLPSIWLEVDVNPNSPTYNEFYKFRIQTSG